MRPLRSVITLARRRAIGLEDARSVEGGLIHGHVFGAVPRAQGSQTALQQVGSLRSVRQVNSVEQVRAVPAVGVDGFRPTSRHHLGSNAVGQLERTLMLRVAAGDARWPFRIQVDRQPSPGEDVGIGGGGLCKSLELALGPGFQRGIHRVDGPIDALPSVTVEPRHRLGELPEIRKVAGDSALPPSLRHPYLDDIACAEEEPDRTTDLCQ